MFSVYITFHLNLLKSCLASESATEDFYMMDKELKTL